MSNFSILKLQYQNRANGACFFPSVVGIRGVTRGTKVIIL